MENALEHELEQLKLAHAEMSSNYATVCRESKELRGKAEALKEQLREAVKQTLNEVEYAAKQTNLPYWNRRVEEVRKQLANL